MGKWASIVGVTRSNLHLISPWKKAEGSRMDVGEWSGQSGETVRWVRLGCGRSKLQPEGQPSPEPVFVKKVLLHSPASSFRHYLLLCIYAFTAAEPRDC